MGCCGAIDIAREPLTRLLDECSYFGFLCNIFDKFSLGVIEFQVCYIKCACMYKYSHSYRMGDQLDPMAVFLATIINISNETR